MGLVPTRALASYDPGVVQPVDYENNTQRAPFERSVVFVFPGQEGKGAVIVTVTVIGQSQDNSRRDWMVEALKIEREFHYPGETAVAKRTVFEFCGFRELSILRQIARTGDANL